MPTNHHTIKASLARMLATEDILVRHVPGAKTASFDLLHRVLNLPVWDDISDHLYDMLLIHEVGHALVTPAGGWLEDMESIAQDTFGDPTRVGSIKGYLNVVEDVRNDMLQKIRYPGCRIDYAKGYQELWYRGFFGTTDDAKVNKMPFIDRMNVYFKAGLARGMLIKFSPKEQVFIDKAYDLKTWEDTVALTKEIVKFCALSKQKLSPISTLKIKPTGGGEGTFEEDDLPEPETPDTEEIEDLLDEEEEEMPTPPPSTPVEFEDDTPEPESEDTSEDDETSPSDEGGGSGDENPEPKSEDEDHDPLSLPEASTIESGNKVLEDMVKNDAPLIGYSEIPKVNPGAALKSIDDYKVVIQDYNTYWNNLRNSKYPNRPYQTLEVITNEFNQFRQTEQATVAYLVKEFEMRKAAEEQLRTSISRSGKLDMGKVHAYAYHNDLFLRRETVQEGKNHGFIMFIDWSGSMANKLRATVKQLISLSMFCRQINVPFDVYSFRDVNGADYNNINQIWPKVYDQQTRKANTIQFGNLKFRNFLSSRMTQSEYNTMLVYLWGMANGFRCERDTMPGTPLNEAIVASEEIIKAFQAKYKIEVTNVIFLTDGDSNASYPTWSEFQQENKGMYAPDEGYMQDNETRKVYPMEIGNGYGYGYNSKFTVTNPLLVRLRDRCGVNLINFHIYDAGHRVKLADYISSRYKVDYTKATQMRDTYIKDGYVQTVNSGYDLEYLVNPKFMNELGMEGMVVKKESKAGLAKAFQKMYESKKLNRVVLQKFISVITGE